MRKALAVMIVLGLVVGSLAAPATAGKKKKKKKQVFEDTFSATLAPWPKLAAWGDEAGLYKPGCASGVEDVNWVSYDLDVKFSGQLEYSTEGFTGDWDIYVFEGDGDVPLARSEQEQAGAALAPPEESLTLSVKKGQQLSLVLCNWLGTPDNSASVRITS